MVVKVSTASPTNPLPFPYPENQASTDFYPGTKRKERPEGRSLRSKVNFHPMAAWEAGTKPPDLILFSFNQGLDI